MKKVPKLVQEKVIEMEKMVMCNNTISCNSNKSNCQVLHPDFGKPRKGFPKSTDGDYYLYLAVMRDDNDIFDNIEKAMPEQLRANILSVTREIASHCNWAKSYDHIGYDKCDTLKGHVIARVGLAVSGKGWERCHEKEKIKISRKYPVYYSSKQLQLWVRKLYRYRQQVRGDFFKRIFEGDNVGC
jgi:hypothetical protein